MEPTNTRQKPQKPQQAPDVVGAYARLSVQAMKYRAHGQPVPPQIAMQMSHIEARARARMTPEQFQSAVHHVNVAVDRILGEENTRAAEQQFANVKQEGENLIRSMTDGILGTRGLTPEQLRAANAEGKVTLKHGKVTRAGDKEWRARTARMDKRGKGYTPGEFGEHMDELLSAHQDADPTKFARVAEQYALPETELRQMARDWKGERLTFESLSRLAKDNESRFDTEEVEVDDDTSRRLSLVQATIDQARENPTEDSMRDLWGDVSREYVEDDDMRGDIARAFVQHESDAHSTP